MYKLPSGIVKACAGIVEHCDTEPYITAIKQAEQVIGEDYELTDEAQVNRQKLVEMVKLNLINRKEYERELLNRRYGLRVTHHKLCEEKKKFCYHLALHLGMIDRP